MNVFFFFSHVNFWPTPLLHPSISDHSLWSPIVKRAVAISLPAKANVSGRLKKLQNLKQNATKRDKNQISEKEAQFIMQEILAKDEEEQLRNAQAAPPKKRCAHCNCACGGTLQQQHHISRQHQGNTTKHRWQLPEQFHHPLILSTMMIQTMKLFPERLHAQNHVGQRQQQGHHIKYRRSKSSTNFHHLRPTRNQLSK